MRRGSSVPASEILVVDPSLRGSLAAQAALDGLGFAITSAASGAVAQRLLLERDFALILIDLRTPCMSAIEAACTIRNHNVPVLFMAACDGNHGEVMEEYRQAVACLLESSPTEPIRRDGGPRGIEQDMLRARLAEEHAHTESLAAKNRELEEARAALEETNQQLAEGARKKDEFIALLAHELRNPLGSISAGIDLFGEIAVPDARLRNVHCAMRRQTDHLARLVDDLLDAARITSGKLELTRGVHVLQPVLKAALDSAAHEFSRCGHTLRVSLPEQPIHVNADPVRLTQVVSNVLVNAARYTPPGGSIALRCEVEEGDARIRVRDNGIGMTPTMLARAFDMFSQQRGEDELLAGATGLGLGLALVKRLMDLHGGTVRALSAGIGSGTEVVLTLPAAPAAGRRRAATANPGTDASSRPLAILVVEDDDDLRELMRELLECWGHHVHDVATASAGIDAISRFPSDLALVDIGLPDMDGYAFARHVCASLGIDRPRLIAISGFSQGRDRKRSADAGFDEHLAKPVGTAELLRVIGSIPATVT